MEGHDVVSDEEELNNPTNQNNENIFMRNPQTRSFIRITKINNHAIVNRKRGDTFLALSALNAVQEDSNDEPTGDTWVDAGTAEEAASFSNNSALVASSSLNATSSLESSRRALPSEATTLNASTKSKKNATHSVKADYPFFCRHNKKDCSLCKANAKQLVRGQSSQQEIYKELELHGHPQSKKKNKGKGGWLTINEQINVLNAHNKRFHSGK